MTIKAKWAKHRETLLPLIQQTERRNDHQFADQIDQALSNNEAFLFVGEDGFFVLQPVSRKGVVIVNVMFAFNWAKDAISRYQTDIERLSRCIGAREIELTTVVTGIVPALLAQGYTKTSGDHRIMRWQKTL